MAHRDPPRPPSPAQKPQGADLRGIDYDDDEPTGVSRPQPSSPDLAQPPRKGQTRIDPNDVFYLTERPLPALTDKTIQHVQSSIPPPVQPRARSAGAAPGPQRPPGTLPPPPRVPSFPTVRTPDPRTSTIAFPLSSRRSSRPAPGPAAAPSVPTPPPASSSARAAAPPARSVPAPVPVATGPDAAGPRHRFPALPPLRSANLDPPVEARWGNAALIFIAGLIALFLAIVVFALVIGPTLLR